jgi:putative ABC transport system ATP-binding protein
MSPQSNSSSDAVLRARGITKVYRTGDVEVHALRGVDLDLEPGELVVLLGPSGSGKSTLFNILGGLDVPTAGELTYRDHDLIHADDAALTRYRCEHVGFVFQFYNLLPALTAEENVAIVQDLVEHSMSAREALETVGLGDRLQHFPAQLSGGEQQRVAIARAVAKRPDLLLCDEPTGALDVQTGRLVLQALLDVNQQLSATTAIITHNAAIARMADRVLHFSGGRIAEITRNSSRISPVEIDW